MASASSTTATSKALIIIDQLPFSAVPSASATTALLANAQRIELGYVPRTTPVGHATISTGQPPSKHRVQGRRWFNDSLGLLDIDHLPQGKLDARFALTLRQSALAARIRTTSPNAIIVAAAAKAFIPFLFGAEDTDVSIYPTDVRPRDDGSGVHRLVIRFHPFTARGSVCVAALSTALVLRTHVLIANTAPGSTLGHRWVGPILELHWIVPAALAAPAVWVPLIAAHGPAIDRYYGDAALDLLDAMRGGPRYLLQSWFSTDFRGHLVGRTHPDYSAAVDAAFDHVERIHQRGYLVAATSDHGGRTTPHLLTHTKAGTSDRHGAAIPLRPAKHVILCGDHLVGYDAPPPVIPTVEYWDGVQRVSATVPRSVVDSSFAPDQRPSWLLLPRLDEKYGTIGLINGGDHGACVEDGELSTVDNDVPLLLRGGTASAWPAVLSDVAAWFVAL